LQVALHPLFMTISFGDSGALQEHDGVNLPAEGSQQL
jgi:hypothetical protein